MHVSERLLGALVVVGASLAGATAGCGSSAQLANPSAGGEGGIDGQAARDSAVSDARCPNGSAPPCAVGLDARAPLDASDEEASLIDAGPDSALWDLRRESGLPASLELRRDSTGLHAGHRRRGVPSGMDL